MANLDNIIQKLNAYLQKHGLPAMAGTPTDADTLYGSVLGSIWKEKDAQKRENLAFEVARELKKYFGGKNLEEIYNKTKQRLDAQETTAQKQAQAQAEAARKNDPNYVPPFDELFKK